MDNETVQFDHIFRIQALTEGFHGLLENPIVSKSCEEKGVIQILSVEYSCVRS